MKYVWRLPTTWIRTASAWRLPAARLRTASSNWRLPTTASRGVRTAAPRGRRIRPTSSGRLRPATAPRLRVRAANWRLSGPATRLPSRARYDIRSLLLAEHDRNREPLSPNQGGGAPPGVDPSLYSWFVAVDEDRNGHITASELQQALTNGNWSHFNPETCRLMIGACVFVCTLLRADYRLCTWLFFAWVRYLRP